MHTYILMKFILSINIALYYAEKKTLKPNEEVHAKIQHAIEPHDDLLTIVKRRKLKWYGHVSRSSGLAKTILQGAVKGEEDKAG